MAIAEIRYKTKNRSPPYLHKGPKAELQGPPLLKPRTQPKPQAQIISDVKEDTPGKDTKENSSATKPEASDNKAKASGNQTSQKNKGDSGTLTWIVSLLSSSSRILQELSKGEAGAKGSSHMLKTTGQVSQNILASNYLPPPFSLSDISLRVIARSDDNRFSLSIPSSDLPGLRSTTLKRSQD